MIQQTGPRPDAADGSIERGGSMNDVVRRRRRILWLLARVGVTLGAFAYLVSIVELAPLAASVKRLPLAVFLAAVALAFSTVAVGSVRWKVLMRACGVASPPSLVSLYRLYLIGMFYNHFAPGAIGGDIVRGVATRRVFGESGLTSAVAITVVERATGFAGLLFLFTIAFTLRPLEGLGDVGTWVAIGALGATAGIVALLYGRSAARWLPKRLARPIAQLPELQSRSLLAVALLCSLASQGILVVMIQVLGASLHPGLAWRDTFVVTPVAMLAAYFPLTIGGAGAREAVFVALLPLVGMAESDAMVTSLAFFAAQLTMAASGGLVSLLSPLEAAERLHEDGDGTGAGPRRSS